MMRKGILLLSIVALLFGFSTGANAQCKQFAKKTCKVGLSPYQHDGNYHAALLVQGEEAELYKTFYSNTEYRIGVCGAGNLENVEFSIIDINHGGKVLYTNKTSDYDWKWDFSLQSSQQLKIVVKVPVPEDATEEPEEGCVAIMFGFKDN